MTEEEFDAQLERLELDREAALQEEDAAYRAYEDAGREVEAIDDAIIHLRDVYEKEQKDG